MALTVSPERPIAPMTLAIIREVQGATTALGLNALLIGATSRIVLLEHIFGLPAGRATRDIDFAFAVADWDQFQSIKRYLISTAPFQEVEKLPQRLLFQPAGQEVKVAVDLIPFGGLEIEKNTIAWPPDMSVLMNVAGYHEALRSAVPVEVEPGVVMPIASIPAIAILKLFAWIDRGLENPKDAGDLVSLLRQYHEAGNQNRIYTDAQAILESVEYDIELSGAWLLGRDAATLAYPETRAELLRILGDRRLMDRLIADMSRALRTREDSIGYATGLLAQFAKGFEA